MDFQLKIHMSNDAYSVNAVAEVQRQLRAVADSLQDMLIPGDGRAILDINGNTVGNWEVTK